MSIESEIFVRMHPEYTKLISFGFHKQDQSYIYETRLNEEMKAIICIDQQITGKVIDESFEEEYINFRLEGKLGEYAAKIKYEYIDLLEKIRDACFVQDYFITPQANRLCELINEKYGHHPEFIFDKFPGYGVFRHPNGKWYALILNVDGKKIDEKLSGEVEILNVKVEESEMPVLVEKKGIYPSYHMSKKNWISIVLDGSVDNDTIMKLIQTSYDFIDDHLNYHEWLVPANARHFDIENYFEYEKEQIWKQSSNIHIGDIVYIYASAPFSSILFMCEATAIDIPYAFKDNLIDIQYVMKIRHIKSYDFGSFTLNELKKYGVTTIRGPRHVPVELSKALHEWETKQE